MSIDLRGNMSGHWIGYGDGQLVDFGKSTLFHGLLHPFIGFFSVLFVVCMDTGIYHESPIGTTLFIYSFIRASLVKLSSSALLPGKID
jgi:hypothetical protein